MGNTSCCKFANLIIIVYSSLWSPSSSSLSAASWSCTACASEGVQAAGVASVAVYSHLLGSSTFISFSELPHLSETCMMTSKADEVDTVADWLASQTGEAGKHAVAYSFAMLSLCQPQPGMMIPLRQVNNNGLSRPTPELGLPRNCNSFLMSPSGPSLPLLFMVVPLHMQGSRTPLKCQTPEYGSF